MTISTETTHRDTQAKLCLKRWWRQVCFMPFLHKNWYDKQLTLSLSETVTQAEKGHRGEIVFIIESRLPIHSAYQQNCRMRAIELFSDYRVWDTEENTGVLVYLNICEHDLEIVADRGIAAKVAEHEWQAICNETLTGLANAKIQCSLQQLLLSIGELLRTHYKESSLQECQQIDEKGSIHDPNGNELADKVLHLR